MRRDKLVPANSEEPVGKMAANKSTGRRFETTSRAEADAQRVMANGPATARRITVVVGLILLPLGTIILVSAPLLRASGWIAAALVLGGASVLAAGIGLVASPAHAEHLRSHRAVDRVRQNRG
jgi:hypothetical protein